MSDLGNILREKRKEKGLSQEEIAKAVGVSQRAYSLWEDGQRNPKTKSLLKLEKILGAELLKTKSEQNEEVDGLDKPTQEKMTIQPNVLIELALQANEARIKELKEHNAFLQRIVETNLGKLDKIELLNMATLADLKASIRYQAKKEAKGDEAKALHILEEQGKIAGDVRRELLQDRTSSAESK